ncbi:MAG: hypothetical protein RR450_06785 [Oscillospiraceae bacterium]
MKRILPLFLVFALLLSGCGEVPMEEQNITLPLVSAQNTGGNPAPVARQIGEGFGAVETGDSVFENEALCYDVSGMASYELVGGKLFSFTFVTVPGSDAAQSDFEKLLTGLTTDYGKPAASDKENGVYQWSAATLGVTVTLTGHLTETPAYTSMTVAGNWEMLCHLGVIAKAETGGFDLLTKLDGEFLPMAVEHVKSVWGEPTKDEDLGKGKRVLTYEGGATDPSLEDAVGDIYFSFYNGKLYSAGVAFISDKAQGNDTGLFWHLYSNLTALYGVRVSEYTLGYALKEAGDYLPAQTQYAVWQPEKLPYALELVRTDTADGQSVQFSMTAGWVLRDKDALEALKVEE